MEVVVLDIRNRQISVTILAFLAVIAFLDAATAKDCGTHGVIYVIEEIDPIQLIHQKLKTMEDRGELKRRDLELQKKTRASIERPKSVEGLTRAAKTKSFYYDPTYVVKEDFYDHQGTCFAKKGTKINPLETIKLSTDLLFFDGDDEEQLAWTKEQLDKSSKIKPIKLILTQGTPLKLAEELNVPVYFDQNGVLTKKLGIKHIPAVVSQDKLQLRIEEIKLPPSRESTVEGDE